MHVRSCVRTACVFSLCCDGCAGQGIGRGSVHLPPTSHPALSSSQVQPLSVLRPPAVEPRYITPAPPGLEVNLFHPLPPVAVAAQPLAIAPLNAPPPHLPAPLPPPPGIALGPPPLPRPQAQPLLPPLPHPPPAQGPALMPPGVAEHHPAITDRPAPVINTAPPPIYPLLGTHSGTD